MTKAAINFKLQNLLPTPRGFRGWTEFESRIHLHEIPLFVLAHTGQTYAALVMKLLNALCSQWPTKLIGASTDRAGNMTGHNAGFSTISRNVSKSPDAHYHIWCLPISLIS